MSQPNTRPELTVYLRSSTPFPARERQEEVIERAERLADDELIADLRVRHWEARVAVRNGDDAEAVATFEALKERAGEMGHSIEPFFQEHERGEIREIVFPVICIAVHVEEELRRVFPCRDEEDAYSVWDCLTALETDGDLADLDD
ncbi:HTH domain-containing protein [Halalkalicoccus tibetensis]|uniref:HTH domain-containing protein n=1 Tax=Halalkalicoccus tibetensis TaxID=175632 RepID=A0ABD5V3M6_9EURY